MNQLSYNTGAFRSAYTREDQITGQRIFGIAFAVAMEVAIIYALLVAIEVVPKPTIPHDFTVVNLRPEKLERNFEPPPAPVFQAPQVTPIEPVVTLTYVPPQAGTITPPPIVPPDAQVTQPVSSPAIFTPARIVMASRTTPEYPPLSRRLGEQGTLRLRLSITEGGTVKDAMIEQSSGYPRLDNAAIAWVKSHWRYQPATEGSRPVASSLSALVTFKLE